MEKKKLEELLPLTKFYAGGDQVPPGLNNTEADLWGLERDWVRAMRGGMDDEFDSENITLYCHYVGPLHSGIYECPTSLRAYIFVRMGKYAFTLKDFAKDFIVILDSYYKKKEG